MCDGMLYVVCIDVQEWVVTAAGKQAAFHGLAEYYQSGAASTKLAYGEEIARLEHAKELIQSAMTRGGKEVDFSNQLSKIESVGDAHAIVIYDF